MGALSSFPTLGHTPPDPSLEPNHNFDRSFSYDQAARLTQALTGDEARGGSTADGAYKENYQYDVWDHMNARTNRIWSKPPDGFTANYINNRNHDPLSLWQYDADGNPTRDDNGPNTFDASSRKSSYNTSRFYDPSGFGHPAWQTAIDTNTYDGDGELVKQLEAIGTDHFDSYWIRSSVLGGAVIFWKEVETDSYHAPGSSNTIQLASIYAQGDRIAQSYNGNVTFEYEEPFTGRRREVEPDPLGQEVGSYDAGPDDPGDVGQYPEPNALEPYIPKNGEPDFINARRVVNGVDRAKLIAGYAEKYQEALKNCGYSAKGK